MTTPQPTPQTPAPSKFRLGRWLWRALLGLVLVLLVLVAVVFGVASTPDGTRFVLNKLGDYNAFISMQYENGNLIDGVAVKNLAIFAGDDVDVLVDKGYIKLGWKSLLAGQVHLQSAQVGTIRILNFAPPNDDPYEYPAIATPIALQLDNASVDKIIIQKDGNDDVILHDITAKKVAWQHTDIKVADGNIGVKVGDSEIVAVKDINGGIDLQGLYPINAKAVATVDGLDKHYIGAFEVHATGTLKRTVGDVKGTYNNAKVTGQIIVQGLDDGTPLSAQIGFDDVLIPYADSQAIHLKNGTASVSGVVKKMDLRIDTDLTAKDAPDGHYHGQAILRPTKGLEVRYLTAKTDEGDLTAQGVLDWDNDFFMTTTGTSNNFDLHAAMPDEYQEYGEYLPKTLNGKVGFDFGLKNKSDETYYKIALAQKTGETLTANIAQKNSTQDDNPNPIAINATWQNYHRKGLSLLGDVASADGQASITVFDKKISIDAQAGVQELLGLPKGDYGATLDKVGDEIILKSSHYQGDMGQLSATGTISLATKKRPLSYDIKATTPHLNPNAYLGKNATPISTIKGSLHAKGKFIQNKTDELPFEVIASDLQATLVDKKSLHLTGKGGGQVILATTKQGKALDKLRANFDGRLATTGLVAGLADNALAFDVVGNTKSLTIQKLTLSGKAGHLSAGGTVGLTDGISWRANVRADELDTRAFYDKAQVLVSGDFESVGKFKDGKLGHTTGGFVGDIKTHDNSLPQGKLAINAIATGNKYTINRLDYDGIAGKLSATGYVDVGRGIVADLTAKMSDLDIGYFVKDRPSKLSGDIAGFVDWQDNEQFIDIRTLAITGQMNDEMVAATGTLTARLDLPKDIKGYFDGLKKNRFDLNDLTNGTIKGGKLYDNLGQIGKNISKQASTLQDRLAQNDKKIRRLIKSLQVRDVMVMFGDNTLGMTGNEHKLAVNLDLKAISQIVPTVRGEIAGTMVLMGDDNSLPTLYSDLKLANISMPSFALRQGSVLAKVVNLANDNSSAVVQGVGVVVAGRSLRELRIDSSGTQQNHNLALFVNDDKMQVRTRLRGGFDGVRYHGVMSEGKFETKYGAMSQLQPFELAFDTKSTTAQLAPHCWQTVSANSPSGTRGKICLKEHFELSPETGKVAMMVDSLDMSVLTPLLPSDISLRARINGKINAHWGKHTAPSVDVVLYSDNGEIGLRQDGLPDTTVNYERLSLIAQSVPSGLKLRTDIKAGQAGDGYIDVLLDPYHSPKPIKGVYALNHLNLAVFRPFFPAMQTLAGEFNAFGGVGGTLDKPLFYGDLSLADGQLALIDVPIRLSGIELTSQIYGTNANLTGSFKSGDGTGTLTGAIDWKNALTAKLSVQGDNLVISQPPLLSAKVSPHFEILTRPTQKFVDIKGIVAIPSATIRPPESTDTVVAQSADVTVIDRRAKVNVDKLLAQVAPWSINADIGVDLGDEIVFRGFGAKLPLAGALHLTQKGQGTMNARGVVQVSERTKVDIVGQNLELNYGQVRFDGDVTNPRLSIEAIREIGGQTVGMRVKGTVANPAISVFNDAGLTEEQAMNALVTGRLSESSGTQLSEQGFRSQVTNNLAAAGLSLGLQSTHGLTNKVGRALGLDSLVVDASGSSDDTNINITGYITPDLYIRYGVGVFNAESTLSMRYQLTRRVYVEATSGIERIVDMVYRWRF